MSWLSDLKWSNRDEHLDAMLTGDAELDESVVSTYDRPQGFKFKLAQRLAAGLLPAVGATDKGKTLQTNETTGAPEWAEASGGGGGAVYATFTESDGDWSCDKTVAELKAALDAGQAVFGRCPFSADGGQLNGVAIMPLDYVPANAETEEPEGLRGMYSFFYPVSFGTVSYISLMVGTAHIPDYGDYAFVMPQDGKIATVSS